MQATINAYLKALEAGELHDILDLFADGATVNSPLYGEQPVEDFFRSLLEDTDHSILTPLRIFSSEKEKSGAAYFLYEWVLNNGAHASFQVVDIFDFDESGQISALTIIYDTAATRPAYSPKQE